ncbi:MAG: restriction endonuclease subunit S [Desulfatitalea sp.]
MDAKQFLAEFGHIVNAPGGVQRVRELILQLAVSGELVNPQKDEGTGSEAIQEALRLNADYESTNKLRKSPPLSPIYSDTTPYTIPNHWVWERLGNIACYVQRGKGPIYSDKSKCLVVSQKCVQWERFDASLARKVEEDSLAKYGIERFLQPNDLLWNSTGTGTVGRACLYDHCENTMAVADSHVTVIRLTNFEPRYIWCVLASPGVQTRIDPTHERSLVSGTTNQVELATIAVKRLLIPCPPIKEQKRIVAKVDELMELCDKLEAQQQERRKLQTLTRTTALDALANAQSARELKAAWVRMQEHLPLLLDDQTSIPALQRLSSKLAVRGLLSNSHLGEKVPLDAITAAMARFRKEYIKKKWLRKQKLVGKAQLESDLYPSHWKVMAFDEIAVVMGGITKGRNLKDRQTASYPYLRVANVQRGYFDLAEMKEIEIPIDEFDKYQLMEGDLLITEGGDWDKVGRTAIWPGKITNCLHQNHIFKARVPSAFILKEWVELVFNSEIGRDYFAGASKQTTNLASINMTQLRSFPFPIPPLSEQKEVLNRLRSTLETSRTLQKQITKKQNMAERFGEAAVAAITGTQLKDKETMKAPKTELVTQLKLKTSPGKKDQAPLAAILAKHNGELPAKGLWHYSGLTIDGFYQQLKTEMARGWIDEPEKARVVEITAAPDNLEAS